MTPGCPLFAQPSDVWTFRCHTSVQALISNWANSGDGLNRRTADTIRTVCNGTHVHCQSLVTPDANHKTPSGIFQPGIFPTTLLPAPSTHTTQLHIIIMNHKTFSVNDTHPKTILTPISSLTRLHKSALLPLA